MGVSKVSSSIAPCCSEILARTIDPPRSARQELGRHKKSFRAAAAQEPILEPLAFQYSKSSSGSSHLLRWARWHTTSLSTSLMSSSQSAGPRKKCHMPGNEDVHRHRPPT